MLSIIFEYNGIKVNDQDDFSGDSYVSLTEVGGLSGSDISVSTESIVDSHKLIDFPGFMEGRIITIGGGIVGTTEDDVLSKIKEMNKSFSVPSYYQNRTDGYRDLIFYRKGAEDSEKYFVSARMKKLTRYDKTIHLHRKRGFYLELFSEDSFIYSYLEKTKILDGTLNFSLPTSLPGSLVKSRTDILTNEGNCGATTFIKITGAFRSLEIENITNGQKLSITALNLTDGEYLEIDCANGIAYTNGDEDNDILDYVSLTSDWIYLDSGDNEVQFRWSSYIGNSEAPKCEITYRDTFNNIEI